MTTTTETPRTAERKTPPTGRVTYEEFLAWTDEDTHAEWVDGAIVVPSPVNRVHEMLSTWLLRVLSSFVEARSLGRVLSPFQVYLPTRPSGREPDLLFVGTVHLDRIQETFLSGPPDAVAEVVSPDSVARDRGDKFQEYEAAGISEYWLLDPLRQEARFYLLGPDGRYRPAPLEDGVFRSAVIDGFWLRVDWLWRDPLPDPLTVLAEILGEEAFFAMIRARVSARGELRALDEDGELA